MHRGSALGAAILAAWLTPGCGHKAGDADAAKGAASAEPATATRVTFRPVITRQLAPTLTYTGTLDAHDQSEVATQVAGVVSKVMVDVGSRVKKGDVMVTIDSREATLRAAQAKASSDQAVEKLGLAPGSRFDPQAVADVRSAKETMDLAVTEADRAKALLASGSVSQSAYDNARATAERARAGYDAALASAKTSYATYEGAQAQLGLAQKSLADTNVRAPFDGAVAARKTSVGEYLTAGKVVATVVNDDPLRLRIDVPEVDLAKVGVGTKVDVRIAAYPDRAFEGNVARIGASINAQSRTLPIEAEIPNHEGVLRPGSFARAEVLVAGAPRATIFVPATAVGTTGTTSRVFVRSGTRVVERLVTPGRRDGDTVEVTGTLQPGDEVAVDNVSRLTDGADVVPAS